MSYLEVFEGKLTLEDILTMDISILERLYKAKLKVVEEKNKAIEDQERRNQMNKPNKAKIITNTGKVKDA